MLLVGLEDGRHLLEELVEVGADKQRLQKSLLGLIWCEETDDTDSVSSQSNAFVCFLLSLLIT